VAAVAAAPAADEAVEAALGASSAERGRSGTAADADADADAEADADADDGGVDSETAPAKPWRSNFKAMMADLRHYKLVRSFESKKPEKVK